MGKKGIYRAKLTRTFTALAVVLSGILFLSLVLTFLNLRQTNEHALETVAETQINGIVSDINYISEAINRFTLNDTVRNWAASEPRTPSYYYGALLLNKMLQSESSYQNIRNISFALTTDDSAFFVVSSTATEDRSAYRDALKDLGAAPEVQVVSSAGGDGTSLRLIVPRSMGQRRLVVICTLTLPRLFIDDPQYGIAVLDSRFSLIGSSPDGFGEKIAQHLSPLAGSFRAGPWSCRLHPVPEFGFTLVSGYRISSEMSASLALLPFFCALLFLLVILIFIRITRTLYRPVDEMVSFLSQGGQPTDDEFGLIRRNAERIEQLTSALEEALADQNRLSERQKYRAFLRGIPTDHEEDDETSAFSVAVMPTDADDGRSIPAHLASFVREDPHLHFVQMDAGIAALVRKADTPEESQKKLTSALAAFLAQAGAESDIQFAVAPPVVGCASVPSAYALATEILQYRYRIRNKAILTEDDMPKDGASMNFSFAEENRLITLLLTGRSEALSVYDEVVRKNMEERALPPGEQRRFAYVMIGIANRLFQELKTDPVQAIGREIDWNALYGRKDPDGVLRDIRTILSQVLAKKQKDEAAQDNEMITAMKNYINEHYMENIMLIDLSSEFNLTPKYCSSLFNRFSDAGFKSYLNSLRIEKACEFIKAEPDIKISYLARKTGFQSPGSFIRVFSKYKGVTPKIYAERIRATGENQEDGA